MPREPIQPEGFSLKDTVCEIRDDVKAVVQTLDRIVPQHDEHHKVLFTDGGIRDTVRDHTSKLEGISKLQANCPGRRFFTWPTVVAVVSLAGILTAIVFGYRQTTFMRQELQQLRRSNDIAANKP